MSTDGNEPIALDLKTAAAKCSLSVKSLTRAIKSAQLSASKIGRRVIVPVSELIRWINDHRCSLASSKTAIAKVVKRKATRSGADSVGKQRPGRTR